MKITENHSVAWAQDRLIYDATEQWLKNSRLIPGRILRPGRREMPYKDWLPNYIDNYADLNWRGALENLKVDNFADLNQPLLMEDEAADTVVSFSVIEHLGKPQIFFKFGP